MKQPKARRVRELAFRALFQFDAMGWEPGAQAAVDASAVEDGERCAPPTDADLIEVRETLFGGDDGTDDTTPPTEAEANEAVRRAAAAFLSRRDADLEMNAVSPAWPAHRRPAADRAILRLGWWEMRRAGVPRAVAIGEAIELAKRYSTDRSPAFVNGVLDAMPVQQVPPGPDGEGA